MKCPRCGWKLGGVSKTDAKMIKENYPNAFSPWTPEQDLILAELVQSGAELFEMCKRLGRQPSAIQKRIELYNFKLKSLSTAQKDYLPDSGAPAPASPTEPVGGG